MELGIYHEFPVLPGRSQAECFAAGFDIVDASEEYGLDVMWLAELHFDKRRALAASPLVLGTAIAARTERIRIGTSVQVLPLANPLRIAEEAATLDHVSKGRLIFGVGRSGVVKTYEALNIAYSESKDREIECLEIIQRAWQEDNFSYKGKFYDIQDVTVVPQPVQRPTPEIRIASRRRSACLHHPNGQELICALNQHRSARGLEFVAGAGQVGRISFRERSHEVE